MSSIRKYILIIFALLALWSIYLMSQRFKVTKYGEVYFNTDKASYLVFEGQKFKELR